MNTTVFSTVILLCFWITSFSFGQTTASIDGISSHHILTPTVEVRELRSTEYPIINRPISNATGAKFDFHTFFANTVQYPELATNNAMEGTVTLHLWVGSDGSVKILEVDDSGYRLLDNAVLKAAEQLPSLRPAIIDGQAVGQLVLVPVHFYME